MSETENIAKMAEKLSNEIFSIFKWEMVGPKNVNWSCTNPKHNKRTHPSDVVFCYKEPYSAQTTYLNIDLKSYAKESIEPFKIENALKNLALAISCAETSSEWQNLYLNSRDNYIVNGLLFIYNHDGEYDKNFYNILDIIDTSKLEIPKGHKIYVLGPKDILFLTSVVNDIKTNREIPLDRLIYYYPDLISKRTNSSELLAANIEMLESPYISLKYAINEKKYLRIYYKEKCEKPEEFLYLFDYLFHYQQVQDCEKITIALYEPCNNASALFAKSKTIYAEDKDNKENVRIILEKIHYESIRQIVTKFSDVEIGMESNNE